MSQIQDDFTKSNQASHQLWSVSEVSFSKRKNGTFELVQFYIESWF